MEDGSSGDQPARGKRSPTSYVSAVKGIRQGILLKLFPEQIVIREGWTAKVVFADILVESAKGDTAEWFKTIVTKLARLKGAELSTYTGDDIAEAHTMTVYLLKAAMDTDNK